MATKDKLPQKKSIDKVWKFLSNLQSLYQVYKDDWGEEPLAVKEKIDNTFLLLRKETYSKIEIDELEAFCISQWKIFFKKVVDSMLKKISNRKTKGSEFADIERKLNEILEGLKTEDLESETYHNLYESDIKYMIEKIQEKINIEKHNNKILWYGLILGALLGYVLPLVIQFIINLILKR